VNGSSHINQLLILNGQFELRAASGSTRVGIGAGAAAPNCSSSIKDLVIVNGTFGITSSYGAGIGTAQSRESGTSCVETLAIQGGYFRIIGDATGGSCGAGIGTGRVDLSGSASSVHNLVIEGGDIGIRSDRWTSPIGIGSTSNYGQAYMGNLVIANGTFDLYSVSRGPCIGMGGFATFAEAEIDDLAILDGTFRLQVDAFAPGIGIGRCEQSTATLHDLTIAGGSFDITAMNQGAGIGTGSTYYDSTTRLDNLTILGGDFSIDTTDTDGHGAALGTGETSYFSTCSIGTILVVNANFTGRSLMAAAIGTGFTSLESTTSSIDNITIVGGTFNLTALGAPLAAAIGTGTTPDAISSTRVGHIGVLGGDFWLSGYSGIGASESGSVESIAIGGEKDVSIRCESVSGPSCLRGEAIVIGGSVTIDAGASRLGQSESVSVSEGSSLLVRYGAKSEFEGILAGSVLHVPEIPTIARSDYAAFSVRGLSLESGRFERRFELEFARHQSFLVSLAKDEEYQIAMAGVPAQAETLMSCNGSQAFQMTNGEVVCYLSPYATSLYSPMPGVSFRKQRRIFSAMSFLWFAEP
jgi:hypothetical protein